MILGYLKSIAGLTLILFSINTFAYGAIPLPEFASTVNQLITRNNQKLINEISIPNAYGTINEKKIAPIATTPNNPLIIHLQDAHANYVGQKNASQIIDYFNNQYGIDTIFVEAAHKGLDGKLLKFTDNDELNKKILDKLAQLGEATQSDLYLSNNPNSEIEFVGIENPELYRENIDSLKEVIKQESEINNWITKGETKLDRELTLSGNKSLIQLLRLTLKQDRKDFNLLQTIKVLDKISLKQLNQNLRNPKEQIRFPNLIRILKMMDEEGEADEAKAREELSVITTNLSHSGKWIFDTVSEATVSKMRVPILVQIEKILFNNKEGNLRFLLEQLHTQTKIDFKQYPNFSKFAKLKIFEQELQANGLFQEIEVWKSLLLNSLATSKEEKFLVNQIHEFTLTSKLLTLTLTRHDWNELKKLRTQNLELRTSISELGTIFTSALSFYLLAEQRETAFIQEIQTTLKEKKISKALVITGGFHASALKEFYEKNNWSYALVSPHIKGNSHALYKEAMLREFSTAMKAHLSAVGSQSLGVPMDHLTQVITPFISASSLGHGESGVEDVTADENVFVQTLEKKHVAIDVGIFNFSGLMILPISLFPQSYPLIIFFGTYLFGFLKIPSWVNPLFRLSPGSGYVYEKIIYASLAIYELWKGTLFGNDAEGYLRVFLNFPIIFDFIVALSLFKIGKKLTSEKRKHVSSLRATGKLGSVWRDLYLEICEKLGFLLLIPSYMYFWLYAVSFFVVFLQLFIYSDFTSSHLFLANYISFIAQGFVDFSLPPINATLPVRLLVVVVLLLTNFIPAYLFVHSVGWILKKIGSIFTSKTPAMSNGEAAASASSLGEEKSEIDDGEVNLTLEEKQKTIIKRIFGLTGITLVPLFFIPQVIDQIKFLNPLIHSHGDYLYLKREPYPEGFLLLNNFYPHVEYFYYTVLISIILLYEFWKTFWVESLVAMNVEIMQHSFLIINLPMIINFVVALGFFKLGKYFIEAKKKLVPPILSLGEENSILRNSYIEVRELIGYMLLIPAFLYFWSYAISYSLVIYDLFTTVTKAPPDFLIRNYIFIYAHEFAKFINIGSLGLFLGIIVSFITSFFPAHLLVDAIGWLLKGERSFLTPKTRALNEDRARYRLEENVQASSLGNRVKPLKVNLDEENYLTVANTGDLEVVREETRDLDSVISIGKGVTDLIFAPGDHTLLGDLFNVILGVGVAQAQVPPVIEVLPGVSEEQFSQLILEKLILDTLPNQPITVLVTESMLANNPKGLESLREQLSKDDLIIVADDPKTPEQDVTASVRKMVRGKKVRVKRIVSDQPYKSEIDLLMRKYTHRFSLEALNDTIEVPDAAKNLLRFKLDEVTLAEQNISSKVVISLLTSLARMSGDPVAQRRLFEQVGLKDKGSYWLVSDGILPFLTQMTIEFVAAQSLGQAA